LAHAARGSEDGLSRSDGRPANFKEPSKNGGHKTLAGAMEHVHKRDPLVTWAWDPGNGRTLPPMSFDAFAAKVQEWVDNGGACPD